MLNKYIRFYTKEVESKRVYTVFFTYLEYTIDNSPNKVLISSIADLNKYKFILSQEINISTVLACITKDIGAIDRPYLRKILPSDEKLAIPIIKSVMKDLIYGPKSFPKRSEETWNVFEEHIKAGIYLGDEYVMRYIGDVVTIERI